MVLFFTLFYGCCSILDLFSIGIVLITTVLIVCVCITEEPDCPSDLKTAEVDSRSVTITWSHPFAGNSPLTNYVIEYKQSSTVSLLGSPSVYGNNASGSQPMTGQLVTKSGSQSTSLSDGGGGEREGSVKLFKEMIESKLNSYTIHGLRPNSIYLIKLLSQNSLGFSDDCPSIQITTDIEAPASAARSAISLSFAFLLFCFLSLLLFFSELGVS